MFGVFAAGDVPAPTEPKKFWLWPCNVRTYALWRACQTQWRVGMQGRTGLDYAGVQVVMNRMRFRGQEGTDAFFGLQAMEIAAVNVWTEEANRRTTP